MEGILGNKKNAKAKKSAAEKRAASRRRREKLEKQHLQHQLTTAADIQAMLLPRRIPRIEGYEMSAYYQPCEYVGGDYYDFLEIDENHLGMLVADVAGHGFPGAMVMIQVRTLMRSEALHSLSPREVLTRINRHLYGEVPKGLFITMAYAVLDIKKSCLTVASAGHNPMYWWRHSKKEYEVVKPGGLTLAIDGGRRFEKITDEILLKMEPLDRIVMYTDGVTEMMDRRNRQFGDDRLCEVFRDCENRSCDEFIAKLNTAMEEFRGRTQPKDDVTVLTLRRLTETPTRIAGFSYVESDRFVRCPVCVTINRREQLRCRSCGTRLDQKPAEGANLEPAPGIRQCPSCKRIFREEAMDRGCPYCRRRLCAICGVRSSIFGNYCSECAPSDDFEPEGEL